MTALEKNTGSSAETTIQFEVNNGLVGLPRYIYADQDNKLEDSKANTVDDNISTQSQIAEELL